MRAIFLALMLALAAPAVDAYNPSAPWYLFYVEQGGSVQKYMGPYRSKFECEAARFRLPYGAQFVGCYQ